MDPEELEPVIDIQVRGHNWGVASRTCGPAITLWLLHATTHHTLHVLRPSHSTIAHILSLLTADRHQLRIHRMVLVRTRERYSTVREQLIGLKVLPK